MKPFLTFTIPPNHVAHWRETERGVEVEMLRFLTLSSAKSRQLNSFGHINRKRAA